MKKFVIGCLIIAAIFVVIGVGCVAYVLKTLSPLISVSGEYQQLNIDHVFTPPADNTLPANRFDAYMDIRRTIMENHGAELEQLTSETQTLNENAGFFEIWGALGEYADLLGRIGTEHIQLMEEAEMSMDEYLYLTEVMHATILLAGERGTGELAELQTVQSEAMASEAAQQMLADINPFLPYRDMSEESLQHNVDVIAEHSGTILDRPETFAVDYLIIALSESIQQQQR